MLTTFASGQVRLEREYYQGMVWGSDPGVTFCYLETVWGNGGLTCGSQSKELNEFKRQNPEMKLSPKQLDLTMIYRNNTHTKWGLF